MNINDIKTAFKAGKLSAKEAIKLLGPHLDSNDSHRVRMAMAAVDYIVDIPSEPKGLTEDELVVAANWERNYRGE